MNPVIDVQSINALKLSGVVRDECIIQGTRMGGDEHITVADPLSLALKNSDDVAEVFSGIPVEVKDGPAPG